MKLYSLILYVVAMVALLVTGCSNDTMENRGELLVAVAKHDMKTTVDLVESGVDVNYQSNPLMTGTLHACLTHSEENLELLNYLISNGANINKRGTPKLGPPTKL